MQISAYGKVFEVKEYRLKFDIGAAKPLQQSSHNHYKNSGDAVKVFIDEETEPSIFAIPIEKNYASSILGNVKPSPTYSLKSAVMNKQFGYMLGAGRALITEYGKNDLRSAQAEELIFDLATDIDEVYQTIMPVAYEIQSQICVVDPENRIKNTVFTNGVINFEPSLNYHYDVGNFKGAMTGVIVYPEKTTGNGLIFPQLDFAVVSDGYPLLILFNGGRLLHAPAPYRVGTGGHRLSLVYYAMENMLNPIRK